MMPLPFIPWRDWRDVLNTALVLAAKAGINRHDLHAAVDTAYDDLAPNNIVPLTTGMHKRTLAVWTAITVYHREYGMVPTIREIQLRTHIPSNSTVTYHLKRLEQRGLLIKRGRYLHPAYTLPPQFITPSGRWTGKL